MKLLIIGDEDLLVEALSQLSRSTVSIAFAADASEAAAQIRDSPPELIVVSGAMDDPQLRALLEAAHEQHGALRVRVGAPPDDRARGFEHCIAETDASAVAGQLARLVAARQGAARGASPAAEPAGSASLAERIEAQAHDLKALERRVAEIALGTTAGLSELIESLDGVQQALKLHTRMIDALKATAGAGAAAPEGAGRDTAEVLRVRLESHSQDLKSLQQRVLEMAVGTTGGLTELVEAADGVQQALKLHARRLDRIEQRVDTELAGLHGGLHALRTDIQDLRREVAAVARSIPSDVPEHDAELELLLDLDEVDGDEPRAQPASAPRGDAAKGPR